MYPEHLPIHPDRVILCTYRRSDGIYMIPDDQNTLTHQYADTNEPPREPPSRPHYSRCWSSNDWNTKVAMQTLSQKQLHNIPLTQTFWTVDLPDWSDESTLHIERGLNYITDWWDVINKAQCHSQYVRIFPTIFGTTFLHTSIPIKWSIFLFLVCIPIHGVQFQILIIRPRFNFGTLFRE